MISKNEAKYIQSLYQKKNRSAEQLFVAEGPKLVNELLAAGFTPRALYATAEWMAQHPGLKNATLVSVEELARISQLPAPNQVLAVVEQRTPPSAPVYRQTLSLVVDGIQDPGNLGTILRIADWFGIQQVLASEDTVELYNPKVVQSTMGSIARVQLWYQPLEQVLRQAGVPVYGALLQGIPVQQAGTVREGLLVIGNESKGIRSHLLPLIGQALTIPRIGEAESLNAAVAAGILLSHLTTPPAAG